MKKAFLHQDTGIECFACNVVPGATRTECPGSQLQYFPDTKVKIK
jgi:hypothetical protein